MLNIIVFSKDRAAQLELFIRSMKFYFKEFNEYKINILYTYSNDKFKEGYEKLFTIHKDENINYIREIKRFKEHILLLLDLNNPYTLFFVDDNVFKNHFTLKSIQFKLFTMKDEILTLSLRLQPNLTYCYPARIRMTQPYFETNFIFKWVGQSGDYGYPMSLDGHIFRTPEFAMLAKALTYNNPNSFESILAGYPIQRFKMICFEESIIVNNPVNKVQNYNNNVHGTVSAEYINQEFLSGKIIDMENFMGIKNISCHQEIKIDFIKSEET